MLCTQVHSKLPTFGLTITFEFEGKEPDISAQFVDEEVEGTDDEDEVEGGGAPANLGLM